MRIRIGVAFLLVSPFLFILTEWLWDIINLKLFLMLSILYIITIPLLILFILKTSKDGDSQ
jgi:hypothetical protein